MRIDHQNNPDLRKLGDLVEAIETAMLTSHAEDGSLVSRPLQTLKLDSRGQLIFFTSAGSAKVSQLTEDREVNFVYAQPSEQRYISVRGRTCLDRDRDNIDELWSASQKIFFPAGKDDPDLMVLRVKVRDAMYWEGSDSMVERIIDFMSDSADDLGSREHLQGS